MTETNSGYMQPNVSYHTNYAIGETHWVTWTQDMFQSFPFEEL